MEALLARRVLSAFRGSTWPVLVDAGECRLVVKLRGTAEGCSPLVAELIVGALAEALGLLTPARYLVRIEPALASDDPHEELRDLLERSVGTNLGFAYLEGFRNLTTADAARIAPELAARIVWLDALVQNPDRTANNPNLMIKAGQIQLIDHGAALGFHHDWASVTEQTPRDPGNIAFEHLLRQSEERLSEADAALAPRLTREVLERAVATVPDDFLSGDARAIARTRAAYVAYLWKRLKSPRPFVAPGKLLPFQRER
jgi:hypothetical protein